MYPEQWILSCRFSAERGRVLLSFLYQIYYTSGFCNFQEQNFDINFWALSNLLMELYWKRNYLVFQKGAQMSYISTFMKSIWINSHRRLKLSTFNEIRLFEGEAWILFRLHADTCWHFGFSFHKQLTEINIIPRVGSMRLPLLYMLS